MHIAIVNSEYPSPSGFDQGGIATYCYTMAEALASQGHKIELFLRQNTIPQKVSDSISLHFYHHKSTGKFARFLNLSGKDSTFWEHCHSNHINELLIQIHRKHKIDIVEYPDYGGLAACSGSLPFPAVINFHTPTEIVDKLNSTTLTKSIKKWHRFEKNALLHRNGYRCPSHALRAEICNLYKLPESSITIIRNPIDTNRFDPIKKQTIDGRFDILFAGRLEKRKGAEILIKALPSILDLNNNINITFAGNTEPGGAFHLRDALERSLTKDQRQRVFFSGPLTPEKLSIIYCRSSLFLFPSIFENAPYALLEAIAAKLPVVASDSSGINEIITHQKNGLLFNPSNINDLINCINISINNYQHSIQMAETAYSELKRCYSPEKITNQTLTFYQSVIEST